MRARFWLPALMVSCALGSAGLAEADKLYKWTDSDGNVHYTDHPPPAEAKKLEQKRFGDKPTDVALPYALQQATKPSAAPAAPAKPPQQIKPSAPAASPSQPRIAPAQPSGPVSETRPPT